MKSNFPQQGAFALRFLGFSEAYAYSFSNAEKDANIGFSDMSGAVAIIMP